MKDRILKIMQLEKMTQQNFAAALGISPASLSSIFNGRTNPTNNHVQAIHNRFPSIRINWLMFGEGDMYDNDQTNLAPEIIPDTESLDNVSKESTPLRDESFASKTNDASEGVSHAGDRHSRHNHAAPPIETIREVVKYIDKPQRRITEIRIFFDDGTYETFSQ